MKNYFIIHGTYGHNKENWFPWLENELTKQGFEILILIIQHQRVIILRIGLRF